MRTGDTNQLDPIVQGLERSLRLLNLLEWIHRILGVVLVAAGLLLIRSAIELVIDPLPSTATWLILEVTAIGLHFVVTAILNQARQELDTYIAELTRQMG